MKSQILGIACLVPLLLASCQSTDSTNSANSTEVEQQTNHFSESKVSLDKLQTDVEQGKKDELTYFAPINFKIAMSQLAIATEEYEDIVKNGASALNIFKTADEQYQEAKDKISKAINVANQSLQLAYTNKEISQQTLAEAFNQDAYLKSINAPKVFAKDYLNINKRVNGLITLIDKGQLESAQTKQPKLLTDMHNLEVRTVRNNVLGRLDNDIALIKEKELAKAAPASLQSLLSARGAADNIITATPRATDEISAAVKLAEFQLAHLYHIVNEVKVLQTTKPESYEKYILAREVELHQITQSLQIEDIRDLEITKQVETLALQSSLIKDKLDTANAAILALRSDSTASSEATESLRTEFKDQLVNLNTKYDDLVVENNVLNKEIQDHKIEIIRLKAYKDGVMELESQRAAAQEKVKVQAQQEQARKEAEALALAQQEQARKEAETLALAQQEQAKKEAEILALAQQEQAKKEVLAEETLSEVEGIKAEATEVVDTVEVKESDVNLPVSE